MNNPTLFFSHPSTVFCIGRVDLNRTGAGITAGALIGLFLLGGGLRLAMRFVALIAGMTPSASVAGTTGILLIGAVFGAILGLIYTPIHYFVPWRWPAKGLLLGGILAGLTALPFLTIEPSGEAALVAPWIGASLFAPLPLIFTLALAYNLQRWERKIVAASPRRVGVIWFLIFLALLGYAFGNVLALGETIRTPTALRQLLVSVGVPFGAMRETQGLLGGLIGLAFCGLHLLLFWLGAEKRVVKLVSMGQLLLFGLFVRTEPLLSAFTTNNAGALGEWLAWVVCLLLLVALVIFGRRQPAWREITLALAFFGDAFLLLWLAILLLPALQLRGWAGVQTLLAVGPYLFPWLLLPATAIVTLWRNDFGRG